MPVANPEQSIFLAALELPTPAERAAYLKGACGADPALLVNGPYKLKEQIGEGGMGLVFVAEQQEPVRRRVALKIIKPGMDSRQVIARFEAERQGLAMMDNQYNGNLCFERHTESCRPFIVM